MAIVYVGIDLAKNVFAVHGAYESGKPELVRPRPLGCRPEEIRFRQSMGDRTPSARRLLEDRRGHRCQICFNASSLALCRRRSLFAWRRHTGVAHFDKTLD